MDCVLAQKGVDLRLAVIDNGPELGAARSVVQSHPGEHRLVYRATGGLTQAENWTAALAAGDARYVALIADDDLWDAGFLARRVAFLEAHPRCALVFSSYREIDDRGRTVAVHAPRLAEGEHEPHAFLPRLYARNPIPFVSVLYRRSALESVGAWFDGRFLAIDYELWARLAVRHPVGYLRQVDCAMRTHAESITATAVHWGQDRLAQVKHFDALIARERPGVPIRPRVRSRLLSSGLLTWGLDALQAGDRRLARRLLRAALRTHPPSLVDPRTPALLLAMAVGARGPRWLSASRRYQHGRNLYPHSSDLRMRLENLRYRFQRYTARVGR